MKSAQMFRAFRKWLKRRANPWRVTRYNFCGFECERWESRACRMDSSAY